MVYASAVMQDAYTQFSKNSFIKDSMDSFLNCSMESFQKSSRNHFGKCYMNSFKQFSRDSVRRLFFFLISMNCFKKFSVIFFPKILQSFLQKFDQKIIQKFLQVFHLRNLPKVASKIPPWILLEISPEHPSQSIKKFPNFPQITSENFPGIKKVYL